MFSPVTAMLLSRICCAARTTRYISLKLRQGSALWCDQSVLKSVRNMADKTITRKKTKDNKNEDVEMKLWLYKA